MNIGKRISFTSDNGAWQYFNPEQAHLMLGPTASCPRILYRLSEKRTDQCWVLGASDENGIYKYAEISDHAAARIYVDRGEEPPADVAYHLVLDEVPRPWIAPGSKKWVGATEFCHDEILHQTPDFRFVIESKGRTWRDRFVAITAYHASNWLGYNNYDVDSDAVFAEDAAREMILLSSTPPDQPSCRFVNASPESPPNYLKSTAPISAEIEARTVPISPVTWNQPAPSQEVSTIAVQELPHCHEKAIRSYAWAVKETGGADLTDKEAYNYIKKSGECEIYGCRISPLPAFKTWERYVRAARKLLKCQKNHRRCGREIGTGILSMNCTLPETVAGP